MIKDTLFRSIFLFMVAGICEIAGGYMIWTTLKNNQPMWLGLLGGIVLALYGVLATFQAAGFGRTYAAYGGIFVVLSLLWGWLVEKVKPDSYDISGAIIILAGAAIIFYAPRK